MENVKTIFANLERIFNSLAELDNLIREDLLDNPDLGESEAEYNVIEEYNAKMINAKVSFELCLEENAKELCSGLVISSSVTNKKLKLPKIKLVRFSSDVKDSLSFWSQFEKDS